MTSSRRDFLQISAAGVVGLGAAANPLRLRRPHSPAQSSLRVLVLGGTGFIGPHLVRNLLQRGHTVTIFNRGRTNTHLFPQVERLIGDRNDDLASLRGHSWDAVIDNSATNPKWVRDSAQLLKDATPRYLFTSTRSVYNDFTQVGLTEETAPTFDPDSSAIDRGERLPYGPSKVLCERETWRAFPNGTLIVRPGLIIGPGDQSDRFTYWPVRIDAGGEVLAPGDPTDPVMFIDVRDLAEWYVHLLEQERTGVYNALGPEAPLSFAEMLYGCRAATSANMSFTWVETDFLLEREIRPYSHMPCWIPPRGDRAGFQRFDLSKSLAGGITYRPLAVTARDTLAFHKTRPSEVRNRLLAGESRAGISREREAALLAEWHALNQ
ncbi:MAG: NAD-dependent epimerase/dehydratase family protein [Gemmatimonadetes bacterium]|nr:NAD-dependent epimerase/dehydratase family protein [Gemmatimonadota bacterium]